MKLELPVSHLGACAHGDTVETPSPRSSWLCYCSQDVESTNASIHSRAGEELWHVLSGVLHSLKEGNPIIWDNVDKLEDTVLTSTKRQICVTSLACGV